MRAMLDIFLIQTLLWGQYMATLANEIKYEEEKDNKIFKFRQHFYDTSQTLLWLNLLKRTSRWTGKNLISNIKIRTINTNYKN